MPQSPHSVTEHVGGSRNITLDDVMSNIGCGRFHTLLLWICGFGFAAMAVEVVVLGFLLAELREEWELTEYQIACIPTVVGLGGIAGELVWGPLADVWGRRGVFMATILFPIIFGIASAAARNVAGIICLRALVSFGYGGNITVDFALFAEFLPKETRGEMLFLMQLFWPMGQLLTCVLAYVVIPSMGWRWFLVATAMPSVVTACFRPFIPESPRYLLLVGQPDEATQVCRDIAVWNGKTPEEVGLLPGAKVSLEDMPSVEEQGSQGLTHHLQKVKLLFMHQYLSTTIGVVVFACTLHTVGYGMLTLMPTFLAMKGIPENSTYGTMILNTLSQIPGILAAGFLASTFGRCLTLKLSLFVTGLAMFFFAGASDPGVVMLSTCIASGCLEAAWCLFHTYVAEVYPTEIRATAFGLITAGSSILSSMVPTICAFIFDSSRQAARAVILAFAGASLAGTIVVSMTLNVETKDRDLKDRLSAKKS